MSVVSQNIGLKKVCPRQIRAAAVSGIPLRSALNKVLIAQRNHLWEKGDISNIRPGNYYVRVERIFRDSDYYNSEFYHWESTIEPSSEQYGWVRGLQQNIYMKIGRTHIFIMDNDLYSGPALVTMHDQGIISSGSRMLHIDEHDDLNPDCDFNLEMFRKSRTRHDENRYVLQKLEINNWQIEPLFNSGIVDENIWLWGQLSSDGQAWIVSGINSEQKRIERLSCVTGDFDIVHVDLDVFLPIEAQMSEKEKKAVLGGPLHPLILKKLDELAKAASKARVVPIATSPCYMNQARAIIYAKELVRKIKILKEQATCL